MTNYAKSTFSRFISAILTAICIDGFATRGGRFTKPEATRRLLASTFINVLTWTKTDLKST